MNGPTSRHRAPLIPTISTLGCKKPAEPERLASEKCQKVSVVIIAVIEIGSEPPKPS
jgi:hypothetical protein